MAKMKASRRAQVELSRGRMPCVLSLIGLRLSSEALETSSGAIREAGPTPKAMEEGKKEEKGRRSELNKLEGPELCPKPEPFRRPPQKSSSFSSGSALHHTRQVSSTSSLPLLSLSISERNETRGELDLFPPLVLPSISPLSRRSASCLAGKSLEWRRTGDGNTL